MELNYPRPNEEPLGKDKLCDDGDKSLRTKRTITDLYYSTLVHS